MNKAFWRGKRVLITGFEGFLGSNLTKRLIPSGAKIIGIDIKVNRKNTILTSSDYGKITVVKGSVTNYRLLKDIIDKYKINIIFYLAAKALVKNCHAKPREAFCTNIGGTWNILEACRGSDTIRSIIIASSDKAYGDHKKLPYTEETHLVGRNPYDASKSCADLIAYSYFHSYKLPVSVTRCGNVYGPGDFNFCRLVPDAIRCALTGRKLLIRSDGKFSRDYVFVEDIIDGYIRLAEKTAKLKLSGEAFNFSNETPVKVIDLVRKISRMAGKEPNYRILNEVRYEIRDQYLCSRKARRLIKWQPKYSLEKGLRKTVEWYSSVLNS